MALVKSPKRVAFQRAQQVQRHANSVEIAEQFGTYCQGRDEGTHCFEHLQNGAFGAEMKTCVCSEHPWDNRTNWELSRTAACATLNARKEASFPVPAELRQVLDLYGGTTGTAYTPPTFDTGGTTGELMFTPATVRAHFQKLRAALVGYYEDSRVLTQPLRPRPDEPEHVLVVRALAAAFARAIVADDCDTFVIGIIGDSTAAGADNCYFDSWGEQLKRTLMPLFSAAGLRLEVRNAAHNGGFHPSIQMACATALFGEPDIAMTAWPYVKPYPVDNEVFVRQALTHPRGIIPQLAAYMGTAKGRTGRDLVEKMRQYFSFGLTIMEQWDAGLTAYGRDSGNPWPGDSQGWWPKLGRAHWGVRGDGR